MAVKRLYAICVLILLSVFLPPISEVPFDSQKTPEVIVEILQHASQTFSKFAPIVHISTLLLLVLLALYGQKLGRVFDGHFALVFLFIALTNNIAVTDSYGFVILTGNLVPFSVVALLWILETYRPRNVFEFPSFPSWRYWVLPFAILAFWFPVSQEGALYLDPLLLLTSDYGVFFCPTVPVVLAVLTLIYPRVNGELLAVTSFSGLLIGLFNAMSLFITPGYTIWLLVVHIPLIVMSLYGLLIPKLIESDHRDNGL
jgi:hypothetical protein